MPEEGLSGVKDIKGKPSLKKEFRSSLQESQCWISCADLCDSVGFWFGFAICVFVLFDWLVFFFVCVSCDVFMLQC